MVLFIKYENSSPVFFIVNLFSMKRTECSKGMQGILNHINVAD